MLSAPSLFGGVMGRERANSVAPKMAAAAPAPMPAPKPMPLTGPYTVFFDFDSADLELASLIGRSQYSPAVDSIDRVKLFKLDWDAVGSEFGSRHTQYEMS